MKTLQKSSVKLNKDRSFFPGALTVINVSSNFRNTTVPFFASCRILFSRNHHLNSARLVPVFKG